MKFRQFATYEEIEAEYMDADIVFLMPDQLCKLLSHSADLFLAVDCIHEMKPERVTYYFNEAERLCSYQYFKCWKQTTVPFDNIVYSIDSYPLHVEWKQLFQKDCVIPSGFFHAFAKIYE